MMSVAITARDWALGRYDWLRNRLKRKPTTGDIGMVGKIGTAQSEIDKTGKIFVHGEYWDVESKHKIAEGEQVRVTKVDGLLLEVEPVSNI